MVLEQVEKYIKLHHELLGSYDPLHMPLQPSQEALHRMRGDNADIEDYQQLSIQELLKIFWKGRVSHP